MSAPAQPPADGNSSSAEPRAFAPYIPDPANVRGYVINTEYAPDDPNRPFYSALWVAAEAGEAATVASLMASGATLHPDEWLELSDYGDEGVLYAVVKGGYRPTASQLGNTLIDAACLGESEAAALRHTRFWLETVDSILGEEVSREMAKTFGPSIYGQACVRCTEPGKIDIDRNKPLPELVSLVQAWITKHGGNVE